MIRDDRSKYFYYRHVALLLFCTRNINLAVISYKVSLFMESFKQTTLLNSIF